MNPWEILAIEPSREEREIKRAYTRKLRQHPPETDPEGFKSLRSAYETALFLARLGSEDLPDLAEDDPPAQALPNGDIDSPAPRTPSPIPAVPSLHADAQPVWQPEAEALLRRIRDDFPDHSKRQFRAYWESVLDTPLLWNLDAKGWVGWSLFEFLGQAAGDGVGIDSEVHIGGEAWIFLDGIFSWLEWESQLYATFGEKIANAVLDPIRAAKGLQQSVDLAVANPRAAGLADLGNDRSPLRWIRNLTWPVGIILINLIHHCTQDPPRYRPHYQAVPPVYDLPASPRESHPNPRPEVLLSPHYPYLENVQPPNPHANPNP